MELKYLKPLIHFLDKYGRQQKTPEEFAKEYICEQKLFVNNAAEETVNLFYKVCQFKQLLNLLLVEASLKQRTATTVLAYISIFYLNKSRLQQFLESFMQLLPPHEQYLFLKFFNHKAYLCKLAEIASTLYDSQYVHNCVVKSALGKIKMLKTLEVYVKEYYCNESNGILELPKIHIPYGEVSKISSKISENPKYKEQKRSKRNKSKKTHVLKKFETKSDTSIKSLVKIDDRILASDTSAVEYASQGIKIEHKPKTQTKITDDESVREPREKISEIISTIAFETIETLDNGAKVLIDNQLDNEDKTTEDKPRLSISRAFSITQFVKIHSLKQNKAAILRTGATINQNTQNAVKVITNLSAGAYFNPYQETIDQENTRALDQQFELEKRRKIRMHCSAAQKNAKTGQTLWRKRNQKLAAKFKTQISHLHTQKKAVNDEQQRKAKETVATVKKTIELSKISYFNMVEEKKKHALELNEEMKRKLLESQDKRKREVDEKVELIKKIRELQKCSNNLQSGNKINHRLTLTPMGLLCEMSLIELQQALDHLKKERTDQVKRLREKIQKEKLRHGTLLNQMMDKIEKHRRVQLHLKSQK